MSDMVLAAIIAAVPPVLAVLWARHGNRQQLLLIHSVVNSRLDEALATITALREELRVLRARLPAE